MSYVGRSCFADPVCEVAVGGALATATGVPSQPTPGPPAAGPHLPERTTPRRVLIVEDEAIVAMTLEALVEDFGLEACGSAATGIEAIELAKALRPDLILMDVSLMGEMDGIEAARLARDAVGVRIVFVTAYGSGEIMDRIRSIHPDAPVVPKPVDPSALRRAIERTELS